jgi:hypothetical protein
MHNVNNEWLPGQPTLFEIKNKPGESIDAVLGEHLLDV